MNPVEGVLAVAVVVAAFATTSATGCATTILSSRQAAIMRARFDSRFGALCTVFSDRRQAEVTQRGRVDAFPLESNPPSEGVPTLSYRISAGGTVQTARAA